MIDGTLVGWPIGKTRKSLSLSSTKKYSNDVRSSLLIPKSDESDQTNETKTLPEGACVLIEVNGVGIYLTEETKES